MAKISGVLYYSIFAILFLSLASSANAISINGVSVSEPDVYYSTNAGNNVVHIRANISGINTAAENVVTVKADFSNLGIMCAGQSGYTINLAGSGDGVWIGECDVTAGAAANAFKTGLVLVDASETMGPTSPQGSISIGVYNVSIPSGNECYRFTDGSTNFVNENNFNSIDITLVVQAYGGSSCVPSGSWGDSWMTIAKIRFLGVNLGDTSKASKITQLIDIVKINYSAPRTHQNNKVVIDTNQLNELSTNTFIEFYRLPFLSQPTIVSSNSVPAQAMTWTNNGHDAALNHTTFNVSFTATPGFSGYTITDNTAPTIVVSGPTAGQSFNSTTQVITATVNGTKTQVSKILFLINNESVASFMPGTNSANCIGSANGESYSCTFNVTKNDGVYALSVQAFDYGAGSGNTATAVVNYVVQMGGPIITVGKPANDSTYNDNEGSMLKLTFNATDGNGISKCWYKLGSGSDTIIDNCSSSAGSHLYLASGTYSLTLSANDTLGKTSNKIISFTVDDDEAPKITDKTSANSSLKKTTMLSVITDENSTCKYDTLDVAYNKMKNKFIDVTISHNTSVNTSGNDTFTFYVRCMDMSENVNENSFKLVLGKTQETAPEAVEEEAYSDPHEIVELGRIEAGQHIVAVDDDDIPVSDILVTTIGVANDAIVTVSVPSKPMVKYDGTVYSYIDVAHGSIRDSLISAAKIKFSVDKKWLDDKKLNASEIFLFRYDDGKWTKLNTTVLKTGSSKIDYIAESPGLSTFAISTESKTAVANALASANTQASSNNNSMNKTLLEDVVSVSANSFNWLWWLLAIVVFIIVVLYIVVEFNERNSPPPIFPSEKTPWAKLKRLFR